MIALPVLARIKGQVNARRSPKLTVIFFSPKVLILVLFAAYSCRSLGLLFARAGKTETSEPESIRNFIPVAGSQMMRRWPEVDVVRAQVSGRLEVSATVFVAPTTVVPRFPVGLVSC